ncbi:Psychimicin [Eumeta japonica]|uniref:Psychimicin n=1 Tax=Eumeta variegata TaxID=151549 RepID=A0A4C1Y550_EUMVA|nr:Psychimicin [Eumeta japonica]
MNKTLVLLLVLAMAASSIDAINNWVRVPPCDQVCSRTNPEKDECCRAHGHAFHATCSGEQIDKETVTLTPELLYSFVHIDNVGNDLPNEKKFVQNKCISCINGLSCPCTGMQSVQLGVMVQGVQRTRVQDLRGRVPLVEPPGVCYRVPGY